MDEDEITEQQLNNFKAIASLAAPIDFLIFGPQKSLGLIAETPLEKTLKEMEGKLLKKREEEKKVEPLRLRSEKTRERETVFGMWQSGY